MAHPEFAGRSSIVTLNAQEPAPLGGVHGTAVASLIGAPADDVGMVGIYPQALLQTWDAARGAGTVLQTSDIVAGVLAAANQGPGVINLSLGAERSALPIQQAIETAIRKGMLVVAAAGNDGDIGSPLSFPASLPHVLTAAATDRQNQVTSFSSRSRFVDIAAPGDDITVATALDDSWAPEAGTSFSSPLVAGAASWVWTVRPELDASQLFEVMRRSAVDIDAPGQGRRYGLRPPQRPRRPRVRSAGARPARAERRHGLRDAGQDVLQRHRAHHHQGEAVDHAHRAAHGRRGPA